MPLFYVDKFFLQRSRHRPCARYRTNRILQARRCLTPFRPYQPRYGANRTLRLVCADVHSHIASQLNCGVTQYRSLARRSECNFFIYSFRSPITLIAFGEMWRNGWRVFPMFVVVSVCRERSVLSIYMHGEIDISLRYGFGRDAPNNTCTHIH